MSKIVVVSLITGVVILGALVATNSAKPEEAVLGTKQPDQGQRHVAEGQSHEPYKSQLASSGPHYSDVTAPANWGIYDQEIRPEVYIHNLEHGGIVVAYDPSKLDSGDVNKLQDLFLPSDASAVFRPSRFVLFPSKDIKEPISIAAWQYTLDLARLDDATLTEFYTQHANKAPENGAAPTNIPTRHRS